MSEESFISNMSESCETKKKVLRLLEYRLYVPKFALYTCLTLHLRIGIQFEHIHKSDLHKTIPCVSTCSTFLMDVSSSMESFNPSPISTKSSITL